jgi:GNAT superfamily N-acetyltransferase
MGEIDIRSASAEDIESVTSLLRKQLEEHRIDTSDDAVQLAINGMLADRDRGFILVALNDKRPVGVAYVSFTWTLEHGGKSAWLEELYVLPDERDRGLGKAMLRAVLEKAREAGCAAVDLEVEIQHARAERLYAREGFRPHTRSRWVRAL